MKLGGLAPAVMEELVLSHNSSPEASLQSVNRCPRRVLAGVAVHVAGYGDRRVPEQVDHVRLLHARPDNNDDQSDVSQQLVRGRVWLYRVGATTGVVRVPCVRY